MKNLDECYNALSDEFKSSLLKSLALIAKNDPHLLNTNLQAIIGLCCGYSDDLTRYSGTELERNSLILKGMAMTCWEHRGN